VQWITGDTYQRETLYSCALLPKDSKVKVSVTDFKISKNVLVNMCTS